MNTSPADNTPILIGSGQCVIRDLNSVEDVRSPVDHAADALKIAIDGTGSLEMAGAIDTLVTLRTFIDSAAALDHPFGTSSKPPNSIAERLSISPQRLIYGEEGGQSPQRFVNEFAESIYRGDSGVVAICGAEATAAMKAALKNGWVLNWSEDPQGDMEDRGFKTLFTEVERHHQITNPPQVYAALENAWRHKHGSAVDEHRRLMAELFSRFSEIAAANPYSQFPTARSADYLANDADGNYTLNVPYGRWLVAQDSVNQSAAVIMTSVGRARELGIPQERWVFLHGYADANDTYVSERADLTKSAALKAAFTHAFAMAGRRIDDIALIDIYSCFPVAVLVACDALDIDWRDDRDLTITGGLPYFGGPGNSYSLHAIAELYTQLRKRPGEFGLVSANGGFLSKESVGIYSTTAVDAWKPRDGNRAQDEVDASETKDVLYPFNGEAVIEAYSVVYKKAIPAIGFAICRDRITDGRVLAKVERGDEETLTGLLEGEPIGRTVSIKTAERGAYMTFSEPSA